MYSFSCTSCGGKIEVLGKNSHSAVCKFCKSAYTLAGDKFEEVGKISDFQTASRIQIGTKGVYLSSSFSVVGLYQVQYEDGFWNEWYLYFNNGMVGWLAEYMGQYAIYVDIKSLAELSPFLLNSILKKEGFSVNSNELEKLRNEVTSNPYSSLNIPSFENTKTDKQVNFSPLIEWPATPTDIREVKVSKILGELPFSLDKKCTKVLKVVDYTTLNELITVDFTNQTIDNQGLEIFVGKELFYEDLKLSNLTLSVDEKNSKNITSVGDGDFSLSNKQQYKELACPNCNSKITEYKKDYLSFTCRSCNCLIDIDGNNGNLNFSESKIESFESLYGKRFEPKIPLGYVIDCSKFSPSDLQSPIMCTVKANKDKYIYEIIGYQLKQASYGSFLSESFIYGEYVLHNKVTNGFLYMSCYDANANKESDGNEIIISSSISGVTDESTAVFSMASYKKIKFNVNVETASEEADEEGNAATAAEVEYKSKTIYVIGSFPWRSSINVLTRNKEYSPSNNDVAIKEMIWVNKNVFLQGSRDVFLSREELISDNGVGDLSWSLGVSVTENELYNWFAPGEYNKKIINSPFSYTREDIPINYLLSVGFWFTQLLNWLFNVVLSKDSHEIVAVLTSLCIYQTYVSVKDVMVKDKKTKKVVEVKSSSSAFWISSVIVVISFIVSLIIGYESSDTYSSGVSGGTYYGGGYTNSGGGFHK